MSAQRNLSIITTVIVAVIIVSGFVGYGYFATSSSMASLSRQNTNLSQQLSNVSRQDSNLNQQISSLNQQISNLGQQASNLNQQVSTLEQRTLTVVTVTNTVVTFETTTSVVTTTQTTSSAVPQSTLVVVGDTYDNTTNTFTFQVQNTQNHTVYAQLSASFFGLACSSYAGEGNYTSQVYTFAPGLISMVNLNLREVTFSPSEFCGKEPIAYFSMSLIVASTTVSPTYQFYVVPGYQFSVSNEARGLGFWVDERDLWSGGEIWNPPPTPQVFFNDYFGSPPYPSDLLLALGMNPTGEYAITPAQEATWISQLASICDGYPNIHVILLFFVNLSGTTISGQADQTATFQSFVAALAGHSSIYGMEYETEYYGDTAAEVATFNAAVTGAGYPDIFGGPTSTYPTAPILGYSTYPYLGGTIGTTLPPGYIGYGYGETGTPNCTSQNPCPIWTQSVITSIVNDSTSAPFTLIYCWLDTDNPAGGSASGGSPLWNSVMLRDWIWNDPYYTSNFVLSGATQGTTSSTTTSSTPTTTTIKTSATLTYTTTYTTTDGGTSTKLTEMAHLHSCHNCKVEGSGK